jgi:hypothetical protein
MKRTLAQIENSSKPDYDEEEHGIAPALGTHHNGNITVYMAHKVIKLRALQQEETSAPSSSIFKNCIVYVNGLTDPPIDELRRLIRVNGGESIMYRAVKISHFVCNYFTDAQLKLEFAKVKLNATNKVHNVTVAWVTESIAAGRRLDENLFLPRGFKKQGSNIAQLFGGSTSSSTTSSSSASERAAPAPAPFAAADFTRKPHQVKPATCVRDLCSTTRTAGGGTERYTGSGDTSSVGTGNVALLGQRTMPGAKSVPGFGGSTTSASKDTLSNSQEVFLEAVPAELREEVVAQFTSINRAKGASSRAAACVAGDDGAVAYVGGARNGIAMLQSDAEDNIINLMETTQSSTDTFANHSSSSTRCSSHGVSRGSIHALYENASLESMVSSIHYSSDGRLLSSKKVEQNLLLYLAELLLAIERQANTVAGSITDRICAGGFASDSRKEVSMSILESSYSSTSSGASSSGSSSSSSNSSSNSSSSNSSSGRRDGVSLPGDAAPQPSSTPSLSSCEEDETFGATLTNASTLLKGYCHYLISLGLFDLVGNVVFCVCLTFS